MAKQNAAQVERQQKDIPTQFREALRLSEDGNTVFVTFSIPRILAILIRKSVGIEIDVARIAGAGRLFSVFMYGLGRKLRDGAPTRESVKNEVGEVVDSPLSDEQKMEYAVSHAEIRRDWLYGDREQQTRMGIDAETQECRRAFVQYLCKTTGLTPKSVPSDIARAANISELEAAAKRAGVPAKAIVALIKRGKAIATLRAEEIEIDLE